MSSYRLENLGFSYEAAEYPVLKNISANIPAGKITLLLGESGAGKTTLIEVLTHIAPEYHPGTVQGQFHCADADWHNLQLKQMARHIGVVFQNPESQFCTYTVWDELAFGLENLSVPPNEIEERVVKTLSLLDITHLKDRPVHALSGGEKQRVAIAAVLTPNPPMLIFDEPTSNLDPAGISELFDIIAQLKTESGKSILIVEHQLEFLIDKVDHLLILGRDGNLLFDGDVVRGLYFLMDQKAMNIHVPPAIEFYRELQIKPEHLELCADTIAQHIRQNGKSVQEDLSSAHIDVEVGTEAALTAENINISLLGKPVLFDINITINQGDFMAIVGANGAGKTTLLHSLLGIYPSDMGSIKLFGKALKKSRRKKWDYAGIAFQNPEWQFVANTVEDEVLYGLKKTKIPPIEKAETVRRYLEQFSLWEKREQSPFVLSQGEKRRLSVAGILVRQQKLLLLDEPTFGQDLRNQNELMTMMQELNQKGITIVMVSHNMDLVYRYCSRAILLQEGRITFDGVPEQLFADESACQGGHLEKPFWMRVGALLPNTPFLRSAEDAIQHYSF